MSWLKEAGFEILRQKPGKIIGKYKISITAARPDGRKRDIDNLHKAISDLLVRCGVIEDDHLCEQTCSRWATSGDGLSVRLEPAGIE